MKRSRHQVDGERNVLPAYEKQRLEKLKKNAEIMESKGYGSLANKILKDKAEHFSKRALDEETFSNEVGEYNTRNEKSSMKVPHETQMKPTQPENAPAKSGTMAQFLTNRASMHKEQMQLDDVTSKRMADFLRKQQWVQQWVQQGGTLPCYENQRQQGVVPKSGSMAKFLSQQASMQGIEQPAQQQAQVEKPYVQPEKMKQEKKVCPPGSLSKYLDKRKKEAQNANRAGLMENGNALENEAQSESGLQSSQFMKEVELEKEVQPDLDIGDNIDLVTHQPESTPTMEATKKATKTKKHRGPTKLLEAHARTLDERPPIVLNSDGQPVGPSRKLVHEYTRFLGTVARDPEMAPLNYCKWPQLPTHDKMWNYIQEKYLIPNEGRKLEALETQPHEGGANNNDPYYEVITKPEHSGRVRLFGKGVTKTSLKKKGSKANNYIIPSEFLESIQRQVVENLREANPGLQIVMPSIPNEGKQSSEAAINPKDQTIVQQKSFPKQQNEQQQHHSSVSVQQKQHDTAHRSSVLGQEQHVSNGNKTTHLGNVKALETQLGCAVGVQMPQDNNPTLGYVHRSIKVQQHAQQQL